MSDLKFCVNCRYFEGTQSPHECVAPENRIPDSIDLVTGKEVTDVYRWLTAKHCREEEISSPKCGPEANWFAPPPDEDRGFPTNWEWYKRQPGDPLV